MAFSLKFPFKTVAATAALATVAALSTLYQVEEGTETVEKTGGKVTGFNGPGWHVRIPIYQGTTNYNTRKIFETPIENQEIYYSPSEEERADQNNNQNESNDTSTSGTSTLAEDNSQQYTIHNANIRTSIEPGNTAFLHEKYGSMRAIESLVSDKGIEAYKSVVRKIDPLKINAERDNIGPQTAILLQTKLNEEVGLTEEGGPIIIVDSVTFLDFNFEQKVATAFEEANEARAGIQKEEFLKRAAAIQIEREENEGKAQAAKTLAIAQGDAAALKVKGEMIAQYPNILTLTALEAWRDGAEIPDALVMSEDAGTLLQLPTPGNDR